MSILSDNSIIDNQDRKLGEFLCKEIASETRLSIVSAYFTIYAYQDLKDKLDSIKQLRFLYGDPGGLQVIDPSEDQNRDYRLTEDGEIELKHVLSQKPIAHACEKWIIKTAEIKTIKQSNFLHGKLYHLEREGSDNKVALGSSNFTRSGLGLGMNPNIELNLEVNNQSDQKQLLDWFNDLWDNPEITRDAKQEVLEILRRLGKNYSPEFVYYKTLFHVLEDKRNDIEDPESLNAPSHFYDTKIWKSLYSFQKDGAVSAINRLKMHNGCIIADSVGLGKTWTALAVIKYFQLLNRSVLVLCPKKLEQNWQRYLSSAGYANNPLSEDRLNYSLLAHTDLNRTKGMSGIIDLSEFNWSNYDLIVIDESHNFRNEGRDKKDEDGNVISKSRYNRLIEDVLKSGSQTKVLMLSATPVNTTLRDLRNQIYLITEKRQDAFRDSLGIDDIQSVFKVAQREFQKWAEDDAENRIKNVLIQRLGADFFAILDAITIARSRRHIKNAYPEVLEKIGGFPERDTPENLYPHTDTKRQLSYEDLHKQITNFGLSIYQPSSYLLDTSGLEKERAKYNFNQKDRETWLVGMMRTNYLKRLESSIHSFTLTIGRILAKMNHLDLMINRWFENPQIDAGTIIPDEDEEDEEFTVGKGRIYKFSELNLRQWRDDIRRDRIVFQKVFDEAKAISAQRDAKLSELKRVLKNKLSISELNNGEEFNRKVLIFTTFSDTAVYLYECLKEWVKFELNVDIAIVTGSENDNKSSLVGIRKFGDILARFAPLAQHADTKLDQIDILIATDCLSEGQNLQDCDLVVNYDIHWNPVRLMQRFGRIDRIGSRNKKIRMVNFWPTEDLDQYLNLKDRVIARMALVDATATGQNDILDENSSHEFQNNQQLEINFRNEQLTRIRDESLDLEDIDDSISLSDLTLDDFLADLLMYLQSKREELEKAPLGISAVVPPETISSPSEKVAPGVIFCLRQKKSVSQRTPNRLHPYFLAYVMNDGTVKYLFDQSKEILTLFRNLAFNRTEPRKDLVNAFDKKTQNGSDMSHYEKMLDATIRKIRGKFSRDQTIDLFNNKSAKLIKQSEAPYGAEAFELITWIAILDLNNESN
ncbi:MAG: helicase-related protein [Bacteroidetes bacterium]|nr:helicase-related protein [Bacteroidota bacterium]